MKYAWISERLFGIRKKKSVTFPAIIIKRRYIPNGYLKFRLNYFRLHNIWEHQSVSIKNIMELNHIHFIVFMMWGSLFDVGFRWVFLMKQFNLTWLKEMKQYIRVSTWQVRIFFKLKLLNKTIRNNQGNSVCNIFLLSLARYLGFSSLNKSS